MPRLAFTVIASALSAGSALAQIDPTGLHYVDRYVLPYTPGLAGTTFSNTLFGGISGLDRDATTGTYYAVADDRSQNAPAGGNNAARFYNLSINVNQSGFVGANPVTINSVQQMKQPDGTTFPTLGVDPESIRYRNGSLYWTSEGSAAASGNPPLQNPFVRQMDLNGNHIREFTNPAKVNPDAVAGQTRGIRNNLAYESLTFSWDGSKIYTATESSLFQDGPRATATAGSTNRIVEFDATTGAAGREFVYVTDPIQAANPLNANDNGLVEMLAIGDGRFLAMERSFALNGEGNNIRIYMIALSGATDVSGMDSLVGQIYTPVSKQLLLTLAQPAMGGAFNPDNVEGLALGPVLPDGNQSFILVSDNNFNGTQSTQFILLAVPAPATGALLCLVGVVAARRRR